jgi:hypothetical protein
MRAAALLLALAVVAAAEEPKTFKSNGPALAAAGGRFVFPVASKLPDNGSFISVDLR